MLEHNIKLCVLKKNEDGTNMLAYAIINIALIRGTKKVAVGKCNTSYATGNNKFVMDWAFFRGIRDKIASVSTFSKSIKNFELKFKSFKDTVGKLPGSGSRAKVTQSTAIKHTEELKKEQKKFREKIGPKLLAVKKFLATGGTAVKGNIPGVNKTKAAWSCNQIMNALDTPISGFYWVKTLCAEKPMRV
jgi:hypothetical protein